MSTDDILSRATRELKQRRDGGAPAPASTRTRIMMSLHRNERKRSATVYILLPAAALLAASTALAASGKLPTVLRSIGDALGVVESAPRPVAPPEPVSSATVAEQSSASHGPGSETTSIEPSPANEAVAKSGNEDPTTSTPRATAAASIAMVPAARTTAERASGTTRLGNATSEAGHVARVPTTPTAPSDSSTTPAVHEEHDVLYEAAHRKHFVDRDWQSALGAWDAYLAKAPDGRFAPEARYNRALVLLRLARTNDAVRALEPFAAGVAYDGYRRDEARKLIEANTR